MADAEATASPIRPVRLQPLEHSPAVSGGGQHEVGGSNEATSRREGVSNRAEAARQRRQQKEQQREGRRAKKTHLDADAAAEPPAPPRAPRFAMDDSPPSPPTCSPPLSPSADIESSSAGNLSPATGSGSSPGRSNSKKSAQSNGSSGFFKTGSLRSAKTGRLSMTSLDEHTGDLKDRVKSAAGAAESGYDVSMFYCKDGLWQFIARHHYFENMTLSVIVFNAIWLGIDTDYNRTGSHLLQYDPWFQVMEHLFCIYFTVELFIRFRAFARKCNCFCDAWFVFDSLLVLMMVVETWIMPYIMLIAGPGASLGSASILRLFRLARLSRLVRMLRSMPELMILVKGMISAMKSVCYVMFLLLVLLYVFAIALTLSSAGFDFKEAYFPSVPYAMYALLIYGTFLDNLSDFLGDQLGAEAWLCLALTFVFILLACLTVLNMLIGVLCEVVAEVADEERDKIREEDFANKLTTVIGQIDTDFNGRISAKEFQSVLANPTAILALTEIEVDPVVLVDFADTLFGDEEKEKDISFEDFITTVLDLRGSCDATVKDVMNVWRQVNPKLEAPQRDLKSMTKSMTTIIAILDSGVARIEEKMSRIVADLAKRDRDTARHLS